MSKFLIDYFISIDTFIDLQINFLKQDYLYQLTPESFSIERELLKEDFYIRDEHILPVDNDPYSCTAEYTKRYFYKNYLPRIISSISADYLDVFYDDIREEFLENQKARRKFIKEKRKYISSIYESINQFSFLDSLLLNSLKSQIIEIEKVVYSPELYSDKYLKAGKLSLIGWKEQDLLLFFTFLREQKVISPSVTDADLGLFLERNFCVEKDDEVFELDNLNKNLSDFASGKKGTYKAQVRLKRLFDKF